MNFKYMPQLNTGRSVPPAIDHDIYTAPPYVVVLVRLRSLTPRHRGGITPPACLIAAPTQQQHRARSSRSYTVARRVGAREAPLLAGPDVRLVGGSPPATPRSTSCRRCPFLAPRARRPVLPLAGPAAPPHTRLTGLVFRGGDLELALVDRVAGGYRVEGLAASARRAAGIFMTSDREFQVAVIHGL